MGRENGHPNIEQKSAPLVTSSKLNSKRNIMSKLMHILNEVYGYFGLFRLLQCAAMIYLCALLAVAMYCLHRG